MTPPQSIDAGAFHDFEHAGWQRASEYYSATFGSLTVQAAEPLLDAVAAGPGARALDVACGPGYVASAAAARGAAVVGIDFSQSMIEEARSRHPGIDFQEGDAEALSFPDGSFDIVVMNFGLLHLARPDAAIHEAFRVLTAGGRYGATVWAAPEQAVGFGVVLRAMEAHGTTRVGLPEGPPFFRFSAADECRRALSAAGFTSVQVRTIPLVWHLPSAESLFEAALHGGVRTSAALQAQTPQALAAIRRAVIAELRQYAAGEGIAVPMPVVLMSARKA
jgi:SAM-dependent methyltransferase